jgi:hypothetical protein
MDILRTTEHVPVFGYRTLRLLVAVIALALPVVVRIFSSFVHLSSISASYHTDAQDVFVGSLFMIGALFVAYKGFTLAENVMAKLGALAAIVAALCPTQCDTCADSSIANIHFVAGAVLFSVIAYFCLGPFRRRATDRVKKRASAKGQRRVRVYTICGVLIVASIVFVGIAIVTIPFELRNAWALVFWAEWVALWAFGFAWLVASKIFPLFADEDERLHVKLK